MAYLLAISFGVAAVGLIACYVVDMVKMLRNPDETNEFALAWLLVWLFGDEQ